MSTATRLLTAEEFALLPDTEMQRSLIRGEVVETMPPGARHAKTASRFDMYLGIWALETQAGEVGIEAGFILDRTPDMVRAPDVYFVRADRVPDGGIPEAFWELAPDLAIEVVSPSESAQDVRDKVHDYLAAGTPLVWVAFPRTREIVAHTPDGLARTFREDELLVAPEVLPGFSCPVRNLFV
jgi:Uma2 family endonuclease